ncbi:hypothetical protein HW555_005245 [Spodoptera exigua]|uniref:Uncharacterized protein n=1 Tax=Spodoptera exigua TaxID=7107 RepID=A0A835L5M5_SPOEX|nr:hypothetical protein HW555_005245 [Spodoptera exigua]
MAVMMVKKKCPKWFINMRHAKSKLTREEILKKKREAEKARLARIKSDPIKLAEYKEKQKLQYLKKKEKGQRKNVEEMTPREQRITRKKWKNYSSNYRQRKRQLKQTTNNFIRQNSPPLTDDEIQPIINEEIRPLKTKLNTQRQKYKRVKKQLKKVIKSVEKTPKTRIEDMSEDITKKKELVKKALFGEVIKTQLEENYTKLKTHEERKKFKQVISGNLVDKYKLWRIKNKAVTYKKTGHNLTNKKINKSKTIIQGLVQKFFEDDSNSRQAAGKKEFVSRKQVKKQKRYLLDTMKNLHKKFLKTTPCVISYSLFTRLRPFWVVPPTLSNRETCSCTIHENMNLQLAALKKANITTVSNHQNMLELLCCDRYSERCLERTCDNCCSKTLTYTEFDNSKPILIKQWVSKKESITDLKTKKQRFVMKCKIETQEMSPRNAITKLENDMVKFFRHYFNILHQCPGIKIDVIEECQIEKMNTIINDKSSEMVAFKGTLLVHQVTGTAYIPNNLTMKSLSCFCHTDGCNHYKLGSISYQTEISAINSTRINTSTVFSDSEDDVPLSTYVKDNDDRSKLDRDLSAPGTSGYSHHQSRYSSGDYVLVKYITKKTEYHYAAVCSSVDDEDGEVRVTFLKICDQNGTLFKLDERDVSDVPMDQVIKKLPVPNLITKGKRVYYQFQEKIDVFEK